MNNVEFRLFDALGIQINKASVDRIVATCYEGSFIGTKVQCQCGNFRGLAHSADWLRL
jgi:hypothetical protein